jgi:hypothetical protein
MFDSNPFDPRELREIEKTLGEVGQEGERLRQQLHAVEERKQHLELVRGILLKLANSWREYDPGKDEEAFFFLSQDGQRAVVKECLPPDTQIFPGTIKEWGRRRQNPAGGRFEEVPPYYQVIDFRKVLTMKCPKCDQQVPVIETYLQTYDSPRGDTWAQDWIIVHCGEEYLLHTEQQPGRF